MYYGEAQTTLDEKGRITISRKFREVMSVYGHVLWYMTRGYDGSIFIFPKEEWDKIRSQASGHASLDAHAIDVRRMMFGSVAEAQLDRQGRLSIPTHLREYAGLDKDVALVGVGEHLELWSLDRWRAFQQAREDEYKAMASGLFAPKPVAGNGGDSA